MFFISFHIPSNFLSLLNKGERVWYCQLVAVILCLQVIMLLFQREKHSDWNWTDVQVTCSYLELLVNLWCLLLQFLETSFPWHCWYLDFLANCNTEMTSTFCITRSICFVPVICWYMLQLYEHLPYTHCIELQFESFNSCLLLKSCKNDFLFLSWWSF